ncbi:50S ribosomal protein L23 [Blattabacterium cuenoti]|uniref:50S ribosomal protein L23 n=1 Tax=Blattabacterium cuenoti TaxID=1653831 RepID=UPI00293BE1A9|nr:50S ribosomal protein L23 [Blattabacterium cuenoti]
MIFLIKPFITDKSSIYKMNNCYIFSVSINWNKTEIKKKINEIFGFSVKKIRTMIYPKKNKSKYTKKGVLYGKTNRIKKVIIQLKENQIIDFFENQKKD